MRISLIATVLALAAFGMTSAAVELPAFPETPPVEGPVDAPSVNAPTVDAPSVDAPALPPIGTPFDPLAGPAQPIASPVTLPEAAPAPPKWLFDPANLPQPAPEAVAATAVGSALALVGLMLYSRLSRGQLLEHERRDEVYKLVQAEPGISLTDVAQRCGLGWGTTVYHLDRLERAGFVASERNGARRCYFPIGTVAKDARAPLGALQQETTRSVATFVVERPGATQTELAEALGMTPSAASKQVSKLENVGLLRREREWKTVRLHPEAKLAELLAPSALA